MSAVYWYVCARSSDVPSLSANTPNFQRATKAAIDALRHSRSSIGDLVPRPIVKPITDHLLCDGSAISRKAFPQLFAEIGTTWGAGDGSTTFNLPNLLGTAIPNATTAPTQVVSSGGTVTTGETVTQPTGTSQTGGTSGGNVSSGGNSKIANFLPGGIET